MCNVPVTRYGTEGTQTFDLEFTKGFEDVFLQEPWTAPMRNRQTISFREPHPLEAAYFRAVFWWVRNGHSNRIPVCVRLPNCTIADEWTRKVRPQ